MLNKIIILISIQFLLSYEIFDNIEDYKFTSNTYIASANIDNLYNFLNPACNSLDKNKYINTSIDNYYEGILKSNSVFFSTEIKYLKKINISLISNRIENIYNTTDAWSDSGNGIIEFDDIDYSKITNFNHNTLGIIFSKSYQLDTSKLPFFKNSFIKYGINSKLSFSSLLSQKSFYHSFDFGILYVNPNYFSSSISPNFGILIKNILPLKYWTTGNFENKNSSLILGSSINLSEIINFKNSSSFLNLDFDLLKFKLNDLGFGYSFKIEENQIKLNLNKSQTHNSLCVMLRFNKQIDIAYILMIPQSEHLTTSQKINFGFNTEFLKNKITNI